MLPCIDLAVASKSSMGWKRCRPSRSSSRSRPEGSGFGVERFPLAVAHHGDQHRDGFVTQPGRRVAMVAEPVREGRLAAGVLQLHVVLNRKPHPLPQTLATLKWDEDVELLRTAQRPPSVEPPGCGTPVEISVESENRARKRQILRTRRPAGLDSVTLSRQRPDVKREPERFRRRPSRQPQSTKRTASSVLRAARPGILHSDAWAVCSHTWIPVPAP